jgi:disulfide bond formation protein DsbB
MTQGPDNNDKLDNRWLMLLAAWLLASAATLGSMFFSEVMDLPPCSLCWYQRIFMFPLPILLFMGMFPFDPKVVRYTLPLSVVGTLVAAYHTLLQWGIFPESMARCSQGASCADVSIAILGIFSIPVLSLIAFLTVTTLLITINRSTSR